MAFHADQPHRSPGAPRRRRRASYQQGAETTIGAAPPPTTQPRDGAHAREREIVAFAKVWAPYGGGSQADIFVTFGLTVEQYFTRLATLLGSSPTAELTPAQRRTILQLCAQRLAQIQHPTTSSSLSDSIGPC